MRQADWGQWGARWLMEGRVGRKLVHTVVELVERRWGRRHSMLFFHMGMHKVVSRVLQVLSFDTAPGSEHIESIS